MALALMLFASCSAGETDFGFRLYRIDSHLTTEALDVVVHQKLILSQEARNALNHGVPLVIETQLALRPAGSWQNIQETHKDFEIRYLPLSKRYQLTTSQPHRVSTFPRLRHVLAELAAVNFALPVKSMPAGEYELRARSYLDKRDIPPPMRLPVWFSARWHHDSGWHSWPLTLATGA